MRSVRVALLSRYIVFLFAVVVVVPVLGQGFMRSYDTQWSSPRMQGLLNGDILLYQEGGTGLMRCTPNGTILWERTYDVNVKRVVERSSGNFVALGVVPDSVQPTNGHPALLFLDDQGLPTAPLLIVGVTVQAYHWFDIAISSSGAIAICTNNGAGTGSIHRFDAAGTPVWSKNANGRAPTRITWGTDGAIYGIYGTRLMKFSADGNLVRRTIISEPSGSLIPSEIAFAQGRPAVFARYTATGSVPMPALILLDTAGQVTDAASWDFTSFGAPLTYYGFSHSPGGFSIAATFASNIPLIQRGVLLTTGLSPETDLAKSSEVNFTYTNMHGTAEAQGGGCYITGYANGNGTSGGHMLLRTDANWNLTTCRTITNPGVAVLGPTVTNDPGALPLTITPPLGSRTVAVTNAGHLQYGVCGTPDHCDVRLRAMLGGPYVGALGSMSDGLRVAGAIPLQEPYTALGYPQVAGGGGESTTNTLLSVSGSSAVVDWVLVELLAATAPYAVVATRCGLIRRNGSITTADGEDRLPFIAPPGNYLIRIRHRNHLSVTTATPVLLGGVAPAIDLTTVATYGTNAQGSVNGVNVMWPGDVSANGQVKYAGAGNDRDPIVIAVGGSTPNNVVTGYRREDVNLDHSVKYAGTNNDRDIILLTVGGTVPTGTRSVQGP